MFIDHCTPTKLILEAGHICDMQSEKMLPEEGEFTPRSVWIYRECIWLSPQMLGWFVNWCTGVDYHISTPYTLYIEREMISHIWGVCLSITDTNLAQK